MTIDPRQVEELRERLQKYPTPVISWAIGLTLRCSHEECRRYGLGAMVAYNELTLDDHVDSVRDACIDSDFEALGKVLDWLDQQGIDCILQVEGK